MKVKWHHLEKGYGNPVTTTHEVPRPEGFMEGGRAFHEMYVSTLTDKVSALGLTCCTYRQYGCAYLGSCTAKAPQDIPLGNITDYPEIENT